MGERGLHVPEDISIASFDDTELAAYLNPPLTSVRSNGYELGRQAAVQAWPWNVSISPTAPSVECRSSRYWCCAAGTGPASGC